MRLAITRMAAALGAIAATACGDGSMSGGSGASTMQAYQAVGQDVASTVARYEGDTASMPDDTACQTAHAAYADHMATVLERMREMSTAMDRHMEDYEHAVPADLDCVAEAMVAEFARHHAAACAATEIEADVTEAAHHVRSMTSLVEHQRVRYESAGSIMGMMGSPGSSTWTCERNADGSFTINGQTWTPGSSLPVAVGEGTGPLPWPRCEDDTCSGCDGSGGMDSRRMM